MRHAGQVAPEGGVAADRAFVEFEDLIADQGLDLEAIDPIVFGFFRRQVGGVDGIELFEDVLPVGEAGVLGFFRDVGQVGGDGLVAAVFIAGHLLAAPVPFCCVEGLEFFVGGLVSQGGEGRHDGENEGEGGDQFGGTQGRVHQAGLTDFNSAMGVARELYTV